MQPAPGERRAATRGARRRRAGLPLGAALSACPRGLLPARRLPAAGPCTPRTTARVGYSGGYGKCLDNTPYKDYIADSPAANKLPGEAFTEDRQCELVFGRGSKICSYMVRLRHLRSESAAPTRHDTCETRSSFGKDAKKIRAFVQQKMHRNRSTEGVGPVITYSLWCP